MTSGKCHVPCRCTGMIYTFTQCELAVISFREIESPNRMLSDGIMSDLRPKAYEMCVEVVLNNALFLLAKGTDLSVCVCVGVCMGSL